MTAIVTAIVITGATRGIGHALADRFLHLGCAVELCGRTGEATDRAVGALAARHGADRIGGQPCDVRDARQLEALWANSVRRLGRVDIWINNAGISNAQARVWDVPDAELAAVIETNVLGVIRGSKVAVRGMLEQGRGAIYNFEGLGSDGRVRAGLVPYGATKAAVRYFTRGLARELQETPLLVGSIQPGMVITEMVTRQFEGRPEEWARAKRVFNLIADRPDRVAANLAPRILANRRSGTHIAYASSWTLLWRFVTAPIARRDLFSGEVPDTSVT